MQKNNFKNLKVWQSAMEIVDRVYEFMNNLSASKKYNLADQMRRCSVSMPSNIAEGSGKRTNIHFAEFLSTALSSSYELETQLMICERRNYGSREALQKIIQELNELQRMLFSFRDSILSRAD